MRLRERALEHALAEWLLHRDREPALEPGLFARQLASEIRTSFLSELRELASIEGLDLAADSGLPPRLPGYRLQRRIGTGGTGEVHEAMQLATGRSVAVKFLHRHIANEPRARARFRREADAARALVHPHIVRVLEAGDHAASPFLVMELLTGRTLQRLLQARLAPEDVDHERAQSFFSDREQLARRFAEIALALFFAHERGVIHRDLKPANIMVGDDGAMTVLDFGLASASSPQSVVLTRTGDFLGTPLYMAPEQARGEGEATPKTDLWSLGAVFYECLAGRSAIEPGPLPLVLDRLLKGQVQPITALGSPLAPELGHLVMSCLACDPQQRPASAQALAQALVRCATASPCAPRIPRRRGRGHRKHPAMRFARPGTTLAASSA